jgi:hypothetical protein
MKKLAEELLGACYYCMHSHDTEEGYWFCAKRRYKYFPEAEWDPDEDDTSECPSYEPDPELSGDDDSEDDDWECDDGEPEEDYTIFDKGCDPDEDMSGEAIFRGY